MDKNKFEQVFLYVLKKVGGKPNVGLTVLHKLMYFIDFDYYEKHSDHLTGVKYKKNTHGPTFDNSLLKNMEKKGSISIITRKHLGYDQKKVIAEKEPNLKEFSGEDIIHINDTLNRLSDKNATQIRDYSHRDYPWLIAKMNKEILYQNVFYRDDNYSVRDYDLDDPL